MYCRRYLCFINDSIHHRAVDDAYTACKLKTQDLFSLCFEASYIGDSTGCSPPEYCRGYCWWHVAEVAVSADRPDETVIHWMT